MLLGKDSKIFSPIDGVYAAVRSLEAGIEVLEHRVISSQDIGVVFSSDLLFVSVYALRSRRMGFVISGIAFIDAVALWINHIICGKRFMRQLARVSQHGHFGNSSNFTALLLELYGHPLAFGTTATLAIKVEATRSRRDQIHGLGVTRIYIYQDRTGSKQQSARASNTEN